MSSSQPPGAGGAAFGGAPTDQLILELRGPTGAWSSAPELFLDGCLMPARWGRQAILVPAGRRQVSVCTRAHTSLVWHRFGRASLIVDVAPGRSVPVL